MQVNGDHGWGNCSRSITAVLTAAFFCALLAGCGSGTYNQRFEETKKFYAYLDRLNRQLGRSPFKGEGVTLRIPRQFVMIPVSAAKPDQKDPRQPTFADITLPGLKGSWAADLALSGNEGKALGYFYVLTNSDLILLGPTGAEQAQNFSQGVVSLLASAVGQPATSVENWAAHEVPKGEAFVEPLLYKTINPALPLKIKDRDYHIRIYSYQRSKEPGQAVIVTVLPDNVASTEKIDSVIDLSLETLALTKVVPPAATGGGKGAPKATGGGF